MKSIEKLTLATILMFALTSAPVITNSSGLSSVKSASALSVTPTPIADGPGIPPAKKPYTLRITPESAPSLVADGPGIPPAKKPNSPQIIPGPAPTLLADGPGIPPAKKRNTLQITPGLEPVLIADGPGIPPVKKPTVRASGFSPFFG